MANSFVNPTQVVQTALVLLRDDMALAATVNRDYEADFGGGKGATVNVRIPATLKARRRAIGATSAIVLDNLTESTIPVSLTDMTYSAVPVTDEDLTLNIEDFSRQVLAPQVTAVAEDIENLVVSTMQAVAETNTTASGVPAYDAANPRAQFVWARKHLRDLGAPQSGLYAACGTGVYADLLNARQIADVSQSGSDAALRDGTVGKVAGFVTLEDNRLADDEIVFYHGDAFTLAVRAPKVPDGVSFGQSLAANGSALRWIKDYDSSILQDRSIVSAFIGCQSMSFPHLKADGTVENVVPAARILTGTALV